MIKYLLSFALLFCLSIQAQELKLAIPKTEVTFFFHGEKVNGTVEGFDGTININLNDLKKSKVQGSVDVSTIQTGIKMRDRHLNSSDYFDSEKFPKMTFVSTSIKEVGDKLLVTGELTIKETTREVQFELVIEEKSIVFTSIINTADYDVMKKKKREKTEVDITVKIPLA